MVRRSAPASSKMGGEAMAQHVGIDTFLDPGAAGGCAQAW